MTERKEKNADLHGDGPHFSMTFATGDVQIYYCGDEVLIMPSEDAGNSTVSFCVHLSLQEWRTATKMIEMVEDNQ